MPYAAEITDDLRREILGAPLRRARKKLGWKKRHLARRLGIARAVVTGLEAGRVAVTADLLHRLDQLNELHPHFFTALKRN
jgi:transcriptional regulator with XRE-family HTH domain